jgi:cytochrome c oxidase subunit II
MRRKLLIPILLLMVLLASGCGSTQPDARSGEELAASKGCLACHAVGETNKIGPSWVGLYGSTVILSDGSTLTADDQYLEESISDPNAKILQGYTPYSMPGFNLDPEEIQSLIAFIKTVR